MEAGAAAPSLPLGVVLDLVEGGVVDLEGVVGGWVTAKKNQRVELVAVVKLNEDMSEQSLTVLVPLFVCLCPRLSSPLFIFLVSFSHGGYCHHNYQ